MAGILSWFGFMTADDKAVLDEKISSVATQLDGLEKNTVALSQAVNELHNEIQSLAAGTRASGEEVIKQTAALEAAIIKRADELESTGSRQAASLETIISKTATEKAAALEEIITKHVAETAAKISLHSKTITDQYAAMQTAYQSVKNAIINDSETQKQRLDDLAERCLANLAASDVKNAELAKKLFAENSDMQKSISQEIHAVSKRLDSLEQTNVSKEDVKLLENYSRLIVAEHLMDEIEKNMPR